MLPIGHTCWRRPCSLWKTPCFPSPCVSSGWLLWVGVGAELASLLAWDPRWGWPPHPPRPSCLSWARGGGPHQRHTRGNRRQHKGRRSWHVDCWNEIVCNFTSKSMHQLLQIWLTSGFFWHFENNSRRILKKLKQFSPKNSSKFVKNSIICQLKTKFFLDLFSFGKFFQKYCPKTWFFHYTQANFLKTRGLFR